MSSFRLSSCSLPRVSSVWVASISFSFFSELERAEIFFIFSPCSAIWRFVSLISASKRVIELSISCFFSTSAFIEPFLASSFAFIASIFGL